MSVRPLVILGLCVCFGCGDDSAGSGTESGSSTTTTGEEEASSSTTTMTPTTSGASETTPPQACVPNEQVECACPEEQVGVQACKADGSGYEACECPAGFCGDGMVDAAEVCDDGVNDGGYGGCAADCGAAGPGCGDAAVNGPEACDDGNAVDGDGCNVDCVVSGSEVWTQGYGGEDAGNARARGVAVDGAGNVIVVGEEFVVGQNANVWLRKYTPAGEVLWSRAWDGPSSGDDIAYAVAVAAGDELVVTGEQYLAGEGADIFVERVAPDGEQIWRLSHSGDAGLGDRGFGVAVDADGNIAVTGEEYKLIGLHNVWTRLMDGDGTEIWTDVFDANAGNDRGNAVAFTAAGDVVVAGEIYVPIGLADLWLRKYAAADGAEVWTQTTDNMAGNDAWHAVAIDADGDIGLVGETYETNGLAAIVVAQYNASGFQVWANYQDSDGSDNDIGHGVAFGPDGALVAAGEEYTANDFARAWVRKYDADGQELWTQTFDGQDSGNDVAWAVAVDAGGFVYAAGETYAINQFAEVWLRKYAP
jgi:cysteine-rich repeat protein